MSKGIPVIEIGFTALRDPVTREFLPAEPLYIEKTERAEESETALMNDVRRLFAHRFQQYVAEGGLIGEVSPDDAAAPDKSRKRAGRRKHNDCKTSL